MNALSTYLDYLRLSSVAENYEPLANRRPKNASPISTISSACSKANTSVASSAPWSGASTPPVSPS